MMSRGVAVEWGRGCGGVGTSLLQSWLCPLPSVAIPGL